MVESSSNLVYIYVTNEKALIFMYFKLNIKAVGEWDATQQFALSL